ncbi:unnamed protein product [Phytomonas sp. Hart1]|nr:unnamed protein product [Phytomonas sp. Hart1]|eukprot:CCW71361.1 unnamed protein product [Phytomonas sp. isolate Hart1]
MFEKVTDFFNKTAIKGFFFTHANMILAILNGFAILLLIVGWGVSSSKEKNIPARTTVWVLGFILLSATILISIGVQKMEPNLLLYYGHQVLSILTLAMMAIAMGTNNVVVNMCAQDKKGDVKVSCGAHLTELFAEILVCIIMVIYYLGTQQRIVIFIDKGILDGIRGRSHSRMEYLM